MKAEMGRRRVTLIDGSAGTSQSIRRKKEREKRAQPEESREKKKDDVKGKNKTFADEVKENPLQKMNHDKKKEESEVRKREKGERIAWWR